VRRPIIFLLGKVHSMSRDLFRDSNSHARGPVDRHAGREELDAVWALVKALPDIQYRVLMAQSECGNLAAAADLEGVSPATLDRWMAEDERFVWAIVQLALCGVAKDDPWLINLKRKAAENLADAARRGDPEALRFIIEFYGRTPARRGQPELRSAATMRDSNTFFTGQEFCKERA
jgi:hypothetical protein